WMKAALLNRVAGLNHKNMRFVAYEGGGEALGALAGGHVQVVAGDAAEVGVQMDQGAPVKVLAILAPTRRGGRWASVPTAREQGYDVQWPILRGVYAGPEVPASDIVRWQAVIATGMNSSAAQQELKRVGLEGMVLSSGELHARISTQMSTYRALAKEFGLTR
ncbi:MAG: tripartite tricarboxylate transporter substrate binding protein, partial [Comamonadaceae bacterium]